MIPFVIIVVLVMGWMQPTLEFRAVLRAQTQGDSLVVGASNHELLSGERALVRITVRSLPESLRQTVITQCTGTFRYNPTVVVLADSQLVANSSFADGYKILRLNRVLNRPLRVGDVLFEIPIYAALGDMETVRLEIGQNSRVGDSYPFTFTPENRAPITARPLDGILRVLDARWSNTLISITDEQPLSMRLAPNPLVTTTTMQLSIDRNQDIADNWLPTVIMYNANGQDITPNLLSSQQSNQLRTARALTLTLDRRMLQLTQGVYYCRFSLGELSTTRLLVVQ